MLWKNDYTSDFNILRKEYSSAIQWMISIIINIYHSCDIIIWKHQLYTLFWLKIENFICIEYIFAMGVQFTLNFYYTIPWKSRRLAVRSSARPPNNK